jgi:hypothetical protein
MGILLPFSGFLRAQGNLGTVTGIVTDSSGGVIPSATVKITEIHTNVTTTAITTGTGNYSVAVPPGTYRVEASKKGFKTTVWENVIVDPATVVTVSLTLPVGNVTQTVEVSAKAPVLSITSPQVATTISLHEIESLPIGAADGGRDPESFVFSSLAGTIGNPYSGSVGGGLLFSGNVLVDGISVADYQRQGGTLTFYRAGFDAFSEVTMQESGYSAEYGNTGGGVLNYQMKGGGNKLHGDAFNFFNNDVLSAYGFALNSIPLPNSSPEKKKSFYNDNNFGVALGGPIVLPHLYNGRGHSFFYATYEGDRYRSLSLGGTTTLPTPAMLKGDFSQLLGAQLGTDALGRPIYSNEIYNPTTTRDVPAGARDPVTGLVNNTGADATIRDPFQSGGQLNVIPASYFSKASAMMLPLFPTPLINSVFNNMPTISNGYPAFDQDLWSIKVDHIINNANRFSAFFDNNVNTQFEGTNGNAPYWTPIVTSDSLVPLGKQNFNAQLARFSEDWSINSHMLNHLGLGFNRFSSLEIQPYPTSLPPSVLGIAATANDKTFPAINFTGHNPLDSSMGAPWSENDVTSSYILTNMVTDLVGKHNIRFGGEVTRYHYNNMTYPQSISVSFSDLETSLPGYETTTGHQFASFIVGAVDGAGYAITPENPGYRQSEFSLYVTDSWKVTSKLTLDYGLRWDIPTPMKEAFDRMSSFNLNLIDPAIGIPGAESFLGSCSGCTGKSSFEQMYWKEFAPRLGLAYHPFKNLVIRTAYGISWSPPIAFSTGNEAFQGFMGAVTVARGGITGPFPGVDPVSYWTGLTSASLPSYTPVGFPAFTGTLPDTNPSSGEGNGVNFIPPSGLRAPQVQNWNLGIQYELPAQILLTVDYLGNKGTYLTDGAMAYLVDSGQDKYFGLGDMLADTMATDLANPATAATLAQFGVTKLPYPGFSDTVGQGILPWPQVYGVTNNLPFFGASTYNTLQISATKRVGNGLSFIIAYNWQKILSNTSDFNAEDGYSAAAVDYYNQKTMKTVATFNYPQMLKLTWVYELPFGRGRHWLNSSGIADRILGGWKLGALQYYASGDPLELGTDISTDLSGGGVLPDQVLGVPEKVPFHGPLNNVTGTQYLNPAAFQNPPVTPINGFAERYGTVAPVLPNIRGPASTSFSENISLRKSFKVTERFKFTFHADIFNLFNRTGLADPVTDVDSPQFGEILNCADGPRGTQLSLQMDW